ncbi:Mce related protein [Rhodococcus sp. AW25M09]|uniref:MCE family protein n=1 Tax=Rhodococcus sp. AW25M09 TaxID=1268303 RepID=UPI0002AC6033|nr:MCE family protein [Rhodococcus sp. AW25M09]CCQ13509.1 Mce related protein [Rhodococcus sp. AW25M09]
MSALVIRGLCVFLVISAIAGVLLARYTGIWRNTVDVVASMPSLGDGLPQNADVKFRGVLVGMVAGVDNDAAGTSTVAIRLNPARAETIPNTVTARVVPSNIFAVSSIELVDTGAGTSIEAGTTIPGDASRETLELQTAMTSLRNVLTAVDPEKSSSVLSTLADTLEGRGESIGTTVSVASKYLSTLRAEIPDLTTDIDLLDTSIGSLSRTAPQLLDTLESSLIPAATIAEKRSQLTNFLTSAAGSTASLDAALAPNLSGAIALVRDLDPVMGALAVNGDDLPAGVRALGQTLEGFNRAFTGPNGRLIWSIDITATPFTPYTRQDCPRYGDLAGPSCSTAPPSRSGGNGTVGTGTVVEGTSGDGTGDDGPVNNGTGDDEDASAEGISYSPGNVGSVGSDDEKAAIGAVLGRPADATSVILLGPLLRGQTIAIDNADSVGAP